MPFFSVLMWQLRPFSVSKQILSVIQFFVEILQHNATTLDETSHCLCMDDVIYQGFVSYNLVSLSAMGATQRILSTMYEAAVGTL